ncbi:MAG: four helix bundle protein [Opitutales bacterium]
MSLSHEKLDVYQIAIDYIAWVFKYSERLTGSLRHARDQWLRASQSIPLNIAEGNGKSAPADRRRFFEIARGSALECAAIQDVLVACNALESTLHSEKKEIIDRIAIMLSRLGGRGFPVQEEQAAYGKINDFDADFDADFERVNA